MISRFSRQIVSLRQPACGLKVQAAFRIVQDWVFSMSYSIPPRYSIVIPTYQRPDGLRNCLEAIAAIPDLESKIEVIVVDDGSTSNTRAVTQPFEADLNLTLISQENQGPASARNAGARLSIDNFCLWLTIIGKNADISSNPVFKTYRNLLNS